MDVTKPYKFIWFGDIHGPKPGGSREGRLSVVVRPNLAPRALWVDGARLTMPVEPKISRIDEFETYLRLE